MIEKVFGEVLETLSAGAVNSQNDADKTAYNAFCSGIDLITDYLEANGYEVYCNSDGSICVDEAIPLF